MERFTIKVNKSAKKQPTKHLCRLCGVDNPNKIPILNPNKTILFDDGEPDLCKKILVCVGIEVNKNDKMPHNVCPLCCDKINDFYEYRAMCAATNIQTRKLLGLPEISKQVKSQKRRKVEDVSTVEGAEESILGVFGDEAKIESVPVAIKTPKTKKNGAKGNRKKAEATVTKASVSSKKTSTSAPLPLLTQKAPNKREIMREKAQRTLENKRKVKRKPSAPVPSKRIKIEAVVPCSICSLEFPSALQIEHMKVTHIPTIRPFGCSSCRESFDLEDENNAHHDWHRVYNIPYHCVHCDQGFDRLLLFNKHVNKCPSPAAGATPTPSIVCDKCHQEFFTENLYNWHSCFISDNSNCWKCQRRFAKRISLFRHLFRCEEPADSNRSGIVVEIPVSLHRMNEKVDRIPNVKMEPETILESNVAAASPSGASDDNGDRNSEGVPSSNEDFSCDKTVDQPNILDGRVLRVCLENISPAEMYQMPPQVAPIDQSPGNLPVRVKQEPVDYDEYPLAHQVSDHPPAALNIKKEVLHAGYNDFDSELARNIKREHGERDVNPPRLRLRIHKEHGSYNSSIVGDTDDSIPSSGLIAASDKKSSKKRYKKPALLAIKIKQEREAERNEISRNSLSPSHENCFSDYANIMNQIESAVIPLPFLGDEVHLPVISNVSSQVDAISLSNQLAIDQVGREEQQITLDNIITFIKIKLEPPSLDELDTGSKPVLDDTEANVDSMPDENDATGETGIIDDVVDASDNTSALTENEPIDSNIFTDTAIFEPEINYDYDIINASISNTCEDDNRQITTNVSDINKYENERFDNKYEVQDKCQTVDENDGAISNEPNMSSTLDDAPLSNSINPQLEIIDDIVQKLTGNDYIGAELLKLSQDNMVSIEGAAQELDATANSQADVDLRSWAPPECDVESN